jgi:cytochrome c553
MPSPLPTASSLSCSRALASVALALSLAACAPPTDVAERGEQLFKGCEPCHGVDGQGNPAIKVPGIAGMPDWYLKTQLTKFRTGIRGAHPDDHEGLRMRPMSRMLRTDEDVADVVAYVSKLPVAHHEAHLAGGDAAAGQASFAVCTACHGQDGMGNETMHAPPIAKLDDWYIAEQLTKFKTGIRGANPADAEGAQMRPMAMTLADDQAVKNVATYIQQTLKK